MRGPAVYQRQLMTTFAVVQVSVCAALLYWTLVNLGTYVSLRRADLGFESDHLYALRVEDAQGTQDVRRTAVRDLQRAMIAVPGVRSVAISMSVPFERFSSATVAEAASDVGLQARLDYIDGAYFATLGVPVLKGRLPSTISEAAISLALADKLFADKQPIGKCIRVAVLTLPCVTVTGVVADMTFSSVTAPADPAIFLSIQPDVSASVATLMIRTSPELQSLATDVRRVLRERLGASVPFFLSSVSDVVERGQAPARRAALLFTILSLAGILLVAAGIQGFVAFVVRESRREIAVRLVLGAPTSTVIVRYALTTLRIVAMGLVLAIPLGLLTRILLLPYIVRADASTSGAAVGTGIVVIVLTGVATMMPLRRAVRGPAMSALAAE